MRSIEQVQKAISQYRDLVRRNMARGQTDDAVRCASVLQALEWCAGDENKFGELLKKLEKHEREMKVRIP
jgi:hypothetical protein